MFRFSLHRRKSLSSILCWTKLFLLGIQISKTKNYPSRESRGPWQLRFPMLASGWNYVYSLKNSSLAAFIVAAASGSPDVTVTLTVRVIARLPWPGHWQPVVFPNPECQTNYEQSLRIARLFRMRNTIEYKSKLHTKASTIEYKSKLHFLPSKSPYNLNKLQVDMTAGAQQIKKSHNQSAFHRKLLWAVLVYHDASHSSSSSSWSSADISFESSSFKGL